MFLLLVAALVLQSPAVAGEVTYPPVVAGYRIEFPRDEGSHPDFRTEWWYVTGWLEDESGAPIGFQQTFFRRRPGIDEANPSRFAAKQLLFAHAAISDPRVGRLLRDERSAREGFGLATAQSGALSVSIDDWHLRASGGNGQHAYEASAQGREFSFQLNLQATQPAVLQGDNGYSRKGPAESSASYYYSVPQLQVSGQMKIRGREHRVHGVAWLDHEWSAELMEPQSQGWDWAGINLDDGAALMMFRMRGIDGKSRWAAATWGGAESRKSAPAEVEWLPLRQWRSPRTGIEYPVEWRVRVGERSVVLRPLMNDQENDTRGSTGTIYWEGAVRAFDQHDMPLGRGYLELTGYGERVKL
ncbi:MAG TPA: lipocalin-like domain-containing protein [Steroidobacteraceae bacterium]|jgi:predicted secreted hydrolase